MVKPAGAQCNMRCRYCYYLDKKLIVLAQDQKMVNFGKAKWENLPKFCRKCDVLEACNDGCPKDRIAKTPDEESGLNYLCPAYYTFS